MVADNSIKWPDISAATVENACKIIQEHQPQMSLYLVTYYEDLVLTTKDTKRREINSTKAASRDGNSIIIPFH